MKRKKWTVTKRAAAMLLAGSMIVGDCSGYEVIGATSVYAEEVEQIGADQVTEVTSMAYYSGNDGPDINRQGVNDATFGFAAPLFNGKAYQELNLADVWDDLVVEEKKDGTWVSIEKKDNPESEYVWQSNWGFGIGDNWDNYVFWFKVNESKTLRIRSKSNANVSLEYHLNFQKLDKLKIDSIETTEPNPIISETTGESAIHFDKISINGASLTAFAQYQQYEDDLEILVDNKDGKGFVAFSQNPDSGFMWEDNFGMWYDGAGGFWFKGVTHSFTIRFQSKSSGAQCDFNIEYKEPERSDYKLSTSGIETNIDANNAANNAASAAIVLPNIGGTKPCQSDLEKFVYEIQKNGKWIRLDDALSEWIYQGNGYSKYSDKNQWGYWVDHAFGLWFQPVTEDMTIRVGYPENGQKGGAINNNYVEYTIKGNPNGVRPDVKDMVDIEVDDNGEPSGDVQESDISVPEGWKMIWHDEFNGNTVNENNWSHQTGFLLEEDRIDTAGWGNNELEWYSDSDKNTSVADGKLKITMLNEEKDFYSTDGQKATAKYSSGKLISKNKFSVKYGRVDFRAKLPSGTGIWPALWMMPNDDIYGTWAASGEIDIFEGKGRVPEFAYGTLHYGAQSPGNKNTGDFIDMVNKGNKKTDMTDWHVYSLVWEEGNIKIYADGKCYFKCTNETFYSASAGPNAPFDQRFYLIMNLAAGGWFDGGTVPGDDFQQADMYVDYVRVYQKQVADGEDEKNDNEELTKTSSNGANDGLYGDYKIAEGSGNNSGENEGSGSNPGGNKEDENTSGGNAGNGNISGGNEGNENKPGNEGNENKPGNEGNENKPGNEGNENKPGNEGNENKPENGNVPDGEHITTPPVNQDTEQKPVDTESQKVTKIKITGISKKIAAGKKIKLKATVSPSNANNKKVIWKSSNTKYAKVSQSGTVTTKKAGKNKSVKITATAADGSGVVATYKIKIMPKAVKKITLNAAAQLKVGKKLKVKATVSPKASTKKINNKLNWTSSNKKYATVNSKGVVTAKKAGKGKTVKITAKSTDGTNKKKTIKIKIVK